jgi:chromate transporter
VIVLMAGMIGYAGGRAGLGAFAGAGTTVTSTALVDSLLGDELPPHVRPGAARVAGGGDLAAALAGAGRAVVGPAGSGQCVQPDRGVLQQDGDGHVRGAYAVLAYVAQQAVENYHWLKPNEMLDGLGMAETTPGPLIMVLQFVGFMAAFRDPGTLSPMLAGALGGLLATWVTFTPCFLWIFLGAPFIETLRGNRALAGALSAITAAVVGVILNLAIWFAIHTIFRQTVSVRGFGLSFDAPVLTSVDPWALALAMGAAFAIFRLKAGMVQTLAACASAGVLLYVTGMI